MCLVNLLVCVWGTFQMEGGNLLMWNGMSEKALGLTRHQVWTLLHETDLGEGEKAL